MTIHTSSDLDKLKTRLRQTWMAGDFGQIAKYTKGEAEQFIARRHIKPGTKVLDVACGTGNVSIPAAKAGAHVTGVDIATNLLTQARVHAKQEDVDITFEEGDAEDLPFEDESFNLVVSMFGVMFAPRPEIAVKELVRVCEHGGQIVLANWTPRGFVGQMIALTNKRVPPPAGMPSFVSWGEEKTVHERLHDGIVNLQLKHYVAEIKFPFSVPDTVEFYRTYFGPTQKAFESLPDEKQPELRRDMEELFKKNNKATDGTTLIDAEYLEVVATRK